MAAISATDLQVECLTGFADETIRRLNGGSFAFLLRDPATEDEMELVGELLRVERAVEGGRVVRIWVTKNEQHWVRRALTVAGPEAAEGREKTLDLGAGRAKAGKTIAVGGGKGGVGKTIVAVNLALTLSRLPCNVTLLDGDAGNCNCNTLLGITRVESSLEDYLRRERSLNEITVPTVYPGLQLVCGAQNKVDALLTAEMSRR